MAKRKRVSVVSEARKIDPKLRMIINGAQEVNVRRAERCPSVAVASTASLQNFPDMREDLLSRGRVDKSAKAVAKSKLKKTTPDIVANVFVTKSVEGYSIGKLVRQTAERGNLATATVRLSDVAKLTTLPGVLDVTLGQGLSPPKPTLVSDASSGPSAGERRTNGRDKHKGGKGVLIGIVDVQGFDFSHPDFLDAAGNTRFAAIWDQGGTRRPGEPNRFDYGHVITNQQMNRAIRASASVGAPAYRLEPQSQMVPGSHGTHVASIAAGNLGLCPDAMLAGVLIDLPEEHLDRRRSFYDSTRIAHAVEYLMKLAQSLGLRLSINVSLGTNGHAHDGSATVNRWIDAALTAPGVVLCAAAGNAGQERSERTGDIGYIVGRIHASGRIPARGLDQDLEWIVVGNAVVDISENELEFWFSPQDRIAVSVRTPSGQTIGPIEPGQFVENQQLADRSFISIYNELYHPSNGASSIAIYLSPFLGRTAVVGVPAGVWTIRLHGREIRDGRFHAWIERDDPSPLRRLDPDRELWSFPSFFSERTNVDDSSISSLACGNRVIGVANLDGPNERIHITSSQGPTRDGRQRPDVAAPGTNIVAAKGFAGSNERWISMTGTSMASPYVAGVAGLMLATQPELTAAQVEGILRRTAKPLPGADFTWRNDAGFGAIDPTACVEEAARINLREDLTP